MNLTDGLEKGKVLGFGRPDRVIETMLSKVLFFGDTVCKIYKWNKAFYGDLSDINFRKEFIAEDFFWNNIMSPDIYIKLSAFKNSDGYWQESSLDDADDICIVMNRLKDDKTIIDAAESKNISVSFLQMFVKDIIKKERIIADFRKNKLVSLFNQDLKDIEISSINDLCSWAYMAQDKLPREKTDRIAKSLFSIVESSEYREWAKKARKSACIDGNGDNFVMGKDKILFIDMLSPKFSWRVEDEVFNIARAATDLSVLAGDSRYADVLYKSYEEISGLKIPSLIKKLYETRGALIQTAYRFILNQEERAKKYLDFAERQ